MLRFDKVWSDELQQYIKTLIITDTVYYEATDKDYFEWSPLKFVIFIYNPDNGSDKIWIPNTGWKLKVKFKSVMYSDPHFTLPIPKWEKYTQEKFDDGISAVMFRNTMARSPQSDSPKIFDDIFRAAINEYRLTM